MLEWLTAIALGVVGTVQYHRLQFGSRFDTFFGDRGDVRGFVYFLEHWYHAFVGKAELLSPSIFYPVKGTLAYSDLLVGFAIPYSFVRALGFSMFSATEIVIIGLTFSNYLAAFLLLNRVLRFNLMASCAAAMFFAFSSPKFFQTGHLQLQFVLCLPLLFICVISFVKNSERLTQRRAVLFLTLAALLLQLQLLTAFYHAWFFILWAILFLVLMVIVGPTRRVAFALIKKFWPALLISTAVAGLSFIPFLLLYLPAARVGQWYSYENVSLMIPEWWSLFAMGHGNYVWGWLMDRILTEPWPATWGELLTGIGLVPSLVFLGFVVWSLSLPFRRWGTKPDSGVPLGEKVRMAAPYFVAVMVLATISLYLIAFKYNGYSPWYYVYYYFPGAGAIRAVSRYVIFLTLPMSIAFAFGLDAALRKLRSLESSRKTALTFGLCVIVAFGVFEQFGVFKIGGTGFSKRTEEAYLRSMAAKLTPDCEVFYIAPGLKGNHNPFEYHYDAMLISAMSGIPTFNASSSQFPKSWFLYPVQAPDYEQNVKNWIALNNITGKVCRLEVGPQVEGFDVKAPSPLDEPAFFVRQHYRDFFGRDPESYEADEWVRRLNDCQQNWKPGLSPANDIYCERSQISLDIFRSTGFERHGSYVLRLYEIGLERQPTFEEFRADLKTDVSSTDPDAPPVLLLDFMKRPEFVARYEGLSPEQFRQKLIQSAGITERELDTTSNYSVTDDRVNAFTRVIQNEALIKKLSNRHFVMLHYFGYLQRAPEASGLVNWLRVLNETGNSLLVTDGFINSVEYRMRVANQ